MFEETLVCMHCGRPVDGRVYCSDECESLDATSPSASASSSAYPSPFLQSTVNAPGNLSDIPPLVPSMPRDSRLHRGHRAQHSVSSSSNSSAGWSALSDDDDDDPAHSRVNIEGEHAYAADPYAEASLKTSLHPPSALLYARRPSSTNHRSTIPLLHRRASSTSSPLGVPVRSPINAAVSSPPTEDDLSDVPSVSLSSSLSSTRSRRHTVRPVKMDATVVQDSSEDYVLPNKRRSRNRTSLPAYFSLLQLSPGSPPSSIHSSSSPGSRQALVSLSQSLRTSPATPRTVHTVLNSAHAHAPPSMPSVSAVDSTPRGRLQRRDPEARSPSGRRSLGRSPPRQSSRTHASSPSPCRHHHTVLASQARARLDSVEKVVEWVSNGPWAPVPVCGRPIIRRNSSPPPKHEMMPEPGATGDLYVRCMPQKVMNGEAEKERERKEEVRGRRRVDELEDLELAQEAPGYGNGRTGLKARDRPRGRIAGLR